MVKSVSHLGMLLIHRDYTKYKVKLMYFRKFLILQNVTYVNHIWLFDML